MTERTLSAPSDADRGDERRTSTRHHCSVPARYRCRSWWLLSRSQDAVVCNISRHGVCLHSARPLEVGTPLTIELLSPAPAGRRLQARVVHSHRTPVLHDWVLGCALDDELSEDEVQALLG